MEKKVSNSIIKVAFIIFLMGLPVLSAYCQKKTLKDEAWKSYLNLDKYLFPFWKADTIYGEVIQVIKKNNKASAGLLFNAKTVLSVKDAFLGKEYRKGTDWTYKNGRIILSKNSAAPFFFDDELVFKQEIPGLSMKGKAENYILYSERGLFQSKQLAITYIKKRRSTWEGPVPQYSENLLPNSLAKLLNGDKFKIVFYGNSIETGANSSGFINTPPFLPTWPEMVVYQLRQKYGNGVIYHNKSVSGMLAKWGKENCGKLVVPEHPDLVIIGFGMNDGTHLVNPTDYLSQIQSIVDEVNSTNRNCEFIIISPMLANPNARQNQIQHLYKYELYKLKRKGIAIADITSTHEELLKRKSYQDMTGNNVNHPNDYLARWYAMMINGFLIK